MKYPKGVKSGDETLQQEYEALLQKGSKFVIIEATDIDGQKILVVKWLGGKMKKEYYKEGSVYDGFTEEQIEEMYKNCHSNLDAPMAARFFTPTCHGCRNLTLPVDLFRDYTCKVFGELPEKYWDDDRYECPCKVPENS